jgi:CHAT domain-containing protein
MLTSQPACTDAAVTALERFAHGDPAALNDLAVAYALRAQREDRPSDLLNALDSAQQAVAASPESPVSRFNRALIEESLGLSAEAMSSWNQFLEIENSPRDAEAREHRDRLLHRIDPTTQWARNQERLPAALRAHDQPVLVGLISPFPSSAERYLEEELLRKDRLGDAKTLAVELARLGKDRYALDVVEAFERSPGSLDAAHLVFADARRADRAVADRADKYANAARLLERGGSPLSLLARLGYAVAVSFDKKPHAYVRAAALLDPIEREARRRDYGHLLARIRSTRATFLLRQGRYVESLAESDGALAEYERLGDAEDLADTRARRIGVFRKAGQNELAWREAMQAMRAESHMVETRTRHALLGDTAESARALGHVSTALLYQNTAVRLIQRDLVATPPERYDVIKGLLINLGVVRRGRAEIEVQLGQYDRAASDLSEAIRLKAPNMDPNAQRILQARIEEIRAQSLMRVNPASAASAFSQALALASTESRTNRALLFAQRAEARRRAGKPADAENDLRAALDELHAEETSLLEHRKKGSGEELWSLYFSRFPETYERLISQLLEEGRKEEAFDYAERARAFEPLNLVSEIAPKEFDGKTKHLAEIRQALPPGTLLIEYSLLENQAMAWLVSRDRFEAIPLKAQRRDIVRLSTALQHTASARNRTDFETQLYALYDALLAEPLTKLGQMPERLVIVPDGSMHGLPFAALRNPRSNHYVIEDVPVEIAGSANLYLVSLARDKVLTSRGTPSVLLVGDPAFNRALALAHGLQPLPHARRECEQIYDLYKPRARMLLESDATIPQFLKRARSSTVIHVAAHTIVNAQAPSRSFILFAPAVNEPGPLDAQALLTRLSPLDRTRLVVLSTCSSAGGLPVGAEGVAPLVRPLIGAGVPAVLGTLWNVEDATAEEILVSFHRHYRAGQDAAVALQSAQVELLTNKNNKPGLRSVLAWAPFQVIGHGSSPFAPAPQHKEKPP